MSGTPLDRESRKNEVLHHPFASYRLCQSFNGKLWDELMNREVFTTLLEAKTLIGDWRRESNEIRPYSSLGCRPPAPEATQPALTLAALT